MYIVTSMLMVCDFSEVPICFSTGSVVWRITLLQTWNINPFTTKPDCIVFNPFYFPIKSLLLGTKRMFKQQNLQMFRLKLNKYV